MKVKEESEKVGLNSTFRKLRSWHLVPSLHGKQMGKEWKQCQTLFFWAPKSLQMVIAAMKFSSVQFSSVTQLCPTPCNPMNHSTPGLPVTTISRSSLRLTSIESVMPSSHLILCHPLLVPPIPPSIRVFSNESTLHMRWPKYWSFSFNISPSNEHPELISFRMDWFDLLQFKGLSRVFSNTTVQKHPFFSTQLFSQSSSHIHT